MNKKISALMVALSCGLSPIFSADGKDPVVTSGFTATPVVIDGRNDEWSGAILQHEKHADVDYAFRHDGQYLYILFIFRDPKSLSSIESTGMILRFGKDGKKTKDRGLRFFNKTLTAEELIAVLEKQGGILPEERKVSLRSRPSYILHSAQVVDRKGNVLADDTESLPSTPPAFRSGKSDEAVVYEFRIPLTGEPGQPAGIDAAPGSRLMVGFEWGGLTKEMKKEIASQSGFRGEGASPNPSSQDLVMEEESIETSGASGPGLSSRLAQLRRQMKKYEFWVEVELAAPKL